MRPARQSANEQLAVSAPARISQPAPHEDVNQLLAVLVSRICSIFQDRLTGVYLYGSLTTGDFDHEVSDIDLLAATVFDVTPIEFVALREMHRRLAHESPEWEDRVEVAYLSVRALATFRSETSAMAVISPGEPFHMKPAGADWLLTWYVIREKGVALFGPPAGEIIAPISRQEFVALVTDYALWWGDRVQHARERKEQAYAIVTLCRALHVHRKAEQVSKRQAALWAQEELPQWSGLIQQALEWRNAWRDTRVDHAATLPETIRFVRFVRDQIMAGGTHA
jgi:predicted nucleotidyltransferase